MISIISDFGDSEYLGVMKGVICSINKDSAVVDLCNSVSKQGIREAAWILLNSYSYFPRDTVFLCVVDPGVGSTRQPVAVRTKNYYFVGPDNGLLSPAIEADGTKEIVKLDAEDASMTFHGRDIFAKAAAMLDKGAPLNKLGKITDLQVMLTFYLEGRKGEVVRIDNFGNIITNIPNADKEKYVLLGHKKNLTLNFFSTYSEAPCDKLFLIKGSSNTLEISIKDKSALEKINLKVGERIEIK